MKNFILLLSIFLVTGVGAQVVVDTATGLPITTGADAGRFVTAKDVMNTVAPAIGKTVRNYRSGDSLLRNNGIGEISLVADLRFLTTNIMHVMGLSDSLLAHRLALLYYTNKSTTDSASTKNRIDSLSNALAAIQLIPGPQGSTGATGSIGATGPAGSNASVTSSSIATALGYTPYNAANPNSYITSVPAQSFSSLTAKPTTLSGYGILDAYPLTGNPANYLTAVTNGQIISALGYTPYSAANPNGYISSVPVQSFSSLTAKPSTLVGYGILDAYPLSGNPSGFLTSVPAQSFSSITAKPTTVAGYGITDYSSLFTSNFTLKTTTDLPEGANLYYTSGRSRAAVSLSAPTGGGAASYDNSTGLLVIPQPYVPTRYDSVIHPLNSNFTVSASREAVVSYSVICSVTNPLLAGTSSVTVYLEFSTNGGTSWKTVSQSGNSSSVTLTVTIAIANTQTGTLTGTIPAGALVRLRSVTAGTASASYVVGQEKY